MRLLHTSDWHVGKTIRGRSRIDEHAAVLDEVVDVARAETVDVVVVAGDLFETSSPGPDAEALVYRTLQRLGQVAPTVVVAGNHDHPQRLAAVAPLLQLGRVTVATSARPVDDGGVLTLTTDGGETARIALLPFVSQRGIVKVDELMSGAAHEQVQAYAERLVRVIAALTHDAAGDHVNVLVGHLFAAGASLGGGERSAHTILDYWVPTQAFPSTLGYVALGHLHRAQSLPAGCPVHYSGSPLMLDFGEQADSKSVNLVELSAGVPAKVTQRALSAGRPLRTITGSLDQTVERIGALDAPAWLRVRLSEARRAGLADELRDALGERSEWVVDIGVDAPLPEGERSGAVSTEGKTPAELFGAFCESESVVDDRLVALFDRLHDEVTA